MINKENITLQLITLFIIVNLAQKPIVPGNPANLKKDNASNALCHPPTVNNKLEYLECIVVGILHIKQARETP